MKSANRRAMFKKHKPMTLEAKKSEPMDDKDNKQNLKKKGTIRQVENRR